MPKTQSALLEAMAERQVTVDGVTRQLPEPFLVLATENPIEQEGTFPLPEAQLDRFFLQDRARLPERSTRRSRSSASSATTTRSTTCGRSSRSTTCASSQRAVEDVYIDELLLRWIVELVRATRELETVALGASVRASLALERIARAWALLHGRDYVHPDDVEACSCPWSVTASSSRRPSSPSTRTRGREAALDAFRDLVFERAPRPEPVGRARAEGPQRYSADVAAAKADRTIPLYPAPAAARLAFGGYDEHPPRRGAPTSRARARTGRATTSARSTGRRPARASSARADATSSSSRERFAEETPRVVIVCDRRPGDGALPERPAVARTSPRCRTRRPDPRRERAQPARARRLSRLATTARRRHAVLAAAARAGERLAQGPRERLDGYPRGEFDAPEDTVEQALAFLATARSAVPLGSFVFVLSDFIAADPAGCWATRGRPRLGRRAGDRAGPAVGAELPGDRRRRVLGRRCTRRADAPRSAGRRRGRGSARAHEDRLAEVQRDFLRLGLDPIVVDDAAPEQVHLALLEWANLRLATGRGVR